MTVQGLAIFDIDGTLTRTSHVDDACFIRAFAETHGLTGISTDWGAYEHSTDVGIGTQLLRQHYGRRDVAADLERARLRFVDLIRAVSAEDPTLCRPMPGAFEMLRELPRRGWAIAIATGGWRDTAQIKLRTAGLFDPAIPAAFADDSISREGIILTAATRARAATDRLTYIGDGRWDHRAACALGIPFIGIGAANRADRLRECGAAHVLPDFTDLEALLTALRS
jgi:phosphoglycolate phosphatase-like HAD superfamily hydrolase